MTGAATTPAASRLRSDWAIAGLALLLVADLVALPWFTVPRSASAIGAPDGWLGVLSVLLALALVIDITVAVARPQLKLPTLGQTPEVRRLALASVAAALCALKFLFHIHFGGFGAGFWCAGALLVALVCVALWTTSSGLRK